MLARFVAFLAFALLAACAFPQPRPLYASLQSSGSYGYFEEQLSGDRFRVGYDAPVETRYRGSRGERQAEVDRQVALAYDMALLRAAELAQARDRETFRISQRQNNVRIEERDEYRGTPYPGFYHPYWHHRYFAVPYYAYPEFIDRVTEIAVSVTFISDLGAPVDDGDSFNARDVIARVSQKYGIARYPAG